MKPGKQRITKKKIVKICFIVIFICIVFMFSINKNPLFMSEHLFEINILDFFSYDIVNIDNSLHIFEYDGEFRVELEFEEDKLDYFCKEISKNFTPKPLEEYDIDNFLCEKIMGSKPTNDTRCCFWYGSVRRIIPLPLSKPKTVESVVIYTPVENGRYKAWLVYTE